MSNIATRKRRHTTTELSVITGTPGETFIDITKPTVVVHDGSTPGGIPLAHEVHTHSAATSVAAGFLSAADKSKLDQLAISGGIQQLLSNATPMPTHSLANFGTDFTLVDDPTDSRTNISISQAFDDEITSKIIAMIIALS